MKKTREKHDIRVLKKLIPYLKPLALYLIFAMILAIFGTIFNIYGPKKLGEIINLIQQSLATGIDGKRLFKEGLMLAIIYVLSAVFLYLSGVLISDATQKLSYKLYFLSS